MRCIVSNCEHNSKNTSQEITYYRFPSEPSLRSAWLQALYMTNCEPAECSVVCSSHFRSEDLVLSNGRWSLRPGSVPAIDVRMCRICFATESRLCSMKTCSVLCKAYENVTQLSLDNDDNIPPYLCAECTQRVLNCAHFRNMSLRAHLILLNIIKDHGYITLELIKSVKETWNPLSNQTNRDIHFEVIENEDVVNVGIRENVILGNVKTENDTQQENVNNETQDILNDFQHVVKAEDTTDAHNDHISKEVQSKHQVIVNPEKDDSINQDGNIEKTFDDVKIENGGFLDMVCVDTDVSDSIKMDYESYGDSGNEEPSGDDTKCEDTGGQNREIEARLKKECQENDESKVYDTDGSGTDVQECHNGYRESSTESDAPVGGDTHDVHSTPDNVDDSVIASETTKPSDLRLTFKIESQENLPPSEGFICQISNTIVILIVALKVSLKNLKKCKFNFKFVYFTAVFFNPLINVNLVPLRPFGTQNLQRLKKIAHKRDKGKLDNDVGGKRVQEKNFCFYCEQLVVNYSRHLGRDHFAEPEVRQALAHPARSPERKAALAELRKKGNYISNTQRNFKPVKRCRAADRSDYLPCIKCLGLYSKKQLWRHLKKCDETASTSKAQVEAQNFLVGHLGDNERIAKVFSRMNADEVSLVAKKDKLICAFGEQYLKSHSPKHFAVVASRKMRELARLLMEVTKMRPDIQSLERALKLQHFDTLVGAAQTVAECNDDGEQFTAATYAVSVATSLERCCRIASEQYRTGASSEADGMRADLETLSRLITEKWRLDDSEGAADEFHVKKFDKTKITLVTDLNLFEEYLMEFSKRAADELTRADDTLNIEAFNGSVEAALCRVFLLNRRRPGELLRVRLHEFRKRDHTERLKQLEDLSVTEKMLRDRLKIIVIRGDRGKAVPVLFSAELEDDITRLLAVRHKYIAENNHFLFAKAGGATVRVDRVLDKYAKASGAKFYRDLVSMQLRKHLAAVTQVLAMNDAELERVGVDVEEMSRRGYVDRLPGADRRAAKMSKLLFLMAHSKVIGEEINEELIGIEFQGDAARDDSGAAERAALVDAEVIKKLGPKKKRILNPMSAEQKRVVVKYFKRHIELRKSPTRAECDAVRAAHPALLGDTDWMKIKAFIQNIYNKRTRL